MVSALETSTFCRTSSAVVSADLKRFIGAEYSRNLFSINAARANCELRFLPPAWRQPTTEHVRIGWQIASERLFVVLISGMQIR